MYLIKHLFAVLLAFIVSQPPAFAARPLSLEAARNILHERSEVLKAASFNVESKKQVSDSLKWLHGPTIALEGQEVWGETRIDVHKKVATPLGAMPVDLEENYNFSGPRAGITGTMPIFTGGKIGAAQKAAKFAVDEAKARERNQRLELDMQLIAKYFGLQLAIPIEKMRAETLGQENRELERAIKFERQGMISQVERMGVKVARDKAEREHLKAVNAVKTAKLELQRLILEDNIGQLSTPLFVLKKAPKDMKRWTGIAFENNPGIAAFEAKVKQADQGVEASKSSWFPQIFAFWEYSLVRHYQTAIEPSWLAGVGARLTLWDARDRRATYKSARASLREARAGHAEARNQVRASVETAWLNAQNAREQYLLTASDTELARENLRLKSRGFGEGLYTSLDVTEARNQLLEAEVERRVAAYQFVVNYAILHAVAGVMDDFMQTYKNNAVILGK